MRTGKFGVKLWFYAVAAFIFGVLDLYLGVIAVCAFAIIAEKDEWLNNQVIQALLLYLIYSLLIVVANWSVGGLARLLTLVESYSAAASINLITTIIKDIIFVVYVVFSIIAMFRCVSEKESVWFLSKVGKKISGLAKNQKEDTETVNQKQPLE